MKSRYLKELNALPSIIISPLVILSSPPIKPSNVVLPDPLLPMIKTNPFSSKVKDTSLTAMHFSLFLIFMLF